MQPERIEVTDNAAEQRYEIRVEGELADGSAYRADFVGEYGDELLESLDVEYKLQFEHGEYQRVFIEVGDRSAGTLIGKRGSGIDAIETLRRFVTGTVEFLGDLQEGARRQGPVKPQLNASSALRAPIPTVTV